MMTGTAFYADFSRSFNFFTLSDLGIQSGAAGIEIGFLKEMEGCADDHPCLRVELNIIRRTFILSLETNTDRLLAAAQRNIEWFEDCEAELEELATYYVNALTRLRENADRLGV